MHTSCVNKRLERENKHKERKEISQKYTKIHTKY